MLLAKFGLNLAFQHNVQHAGVHQDQTRHTNNMHASQKHSDTHDKIITLAWKPVKHTQTLSDGCRWETREKENWIKTRSGSDFTHPNVCHWSCVADNRCRVRFDKSNVLHFTQSATLQPECDRYANYNSLTLHTSRREQSGEPRPTLARTKTQVTGDLVRLNVIKSQRS